LLSLGYTPETVRGQLKVLGQLGRWMSVNGLTPAELSPGCIEEFLVDRRADAYRHGAMPAGPRFAAGTFGRRERHRGRRPPPRTALEDLVDAYRGWLLHERGLAAATVLRYVNSARRFLRQRAGEGSGVDVVSLTGAEVSAFLLAEYTRCSVGAAKGRVAELRALLRYLFVQGLTPLALSAAVPRRGWHDTGIPPTLSAEDVQALLEACDRSTPTGVRDFAMVTLLARLGLRSAEVAGLELNDVDWRRGELAIRGKARRRDRLPLPAEVGAALAAYLVDARPPPGVGRCS
jgi:integrase